MCCRVGACCRVRAWLNLLSLLAYMVTRPNYSVANMRFSTYKTIASTAGLDIRWVLRVFLYLILLLYHISCLMSSVYCIFASIFQRKMLTAARNLPYFRSLSTSPGRHLVPHSLLG